MTTLDGDEISASKHARHSAGPHLNPEHQGRAFGRICSQVITRVSFGLLCSGLTFQVEEVLDQVDRVGLLHR